MNQPSSLLELYKCAVLTAIAVVLIAIFLKIPTPFTIENVRANKVQMGEIPLVRIQGGQIDAEVSGSVEIEN